MSSKSTILSQKDHNLLESLIATYGRVVYFSNIVQIAKQYTHNRQSIRNWVNKLTTAGWLIRLNRGVYAISSLESLGATTLSSLAIAQILVPASYISFEAALQYHGLFDQMLQTIRSVSLKKQKEKVIQDIRYRFVVTSQKHFFGYTEEIVDNRFVKIATIEKALIDMLHFQRSVYAIDLVQEKFIGYKDTIDFEALAKSLATEPATINRIIGFLFDRCEINSDSIYAMVRGDRGVSKMTADSTEFDAKWRLYYHKHFQAKSR